MAAQRDRSAEINASVIGGLGILGFSFTLPMTRIAVAGLDPIIVGMGRVIVSAALAATVMAFRRSRFPGWRRVPNLLAVSLGVIISYPLLSSYAMQRVPSAHGAIVAGLVPLSTAFFAVVRAHERPSLAFWCAAIAGSAAVVIFALAEGGWTLRSADILLLIAVVLCGLGYAEGGRLAKEMGGLNMVSWAMILAVPIAAGPVALVIAHRGLHASPLCWAAFAYTCTISLFLAFWAWYAGLARGGIARISQLQLCQVFLTLTWAALLLHERVTPWAVLTAAFVVASVAITRRTAVVRHYPVESEGSAP